MPRSKQQPKQRTLLNSITEDVEEFIKSVIAENYLPVISEHIDDGGAFDVSSLCDLLDIPYKKPSTQSAKKQTSSATKSTPKSSSGWVHPKDFDNEHTTDGCQYFPTRGAKPYKFCKNKVSDKGLNVFCTTCTKRKIFESIKKEIKRNGGSFDYDERYRSNMAEYTERYNKEHNISVPVPKSKGGKKGSSFGENIVPDDPSDDDDSIYEWTYDESKDYSWWPKGKFVLHDVSTDDAEDYIVMGVAESADKKMRPLSAAEIKMAVKEGFQVHASAKQKTKGKPTPSTNSKPKRPTSSVKGKPVPKRSTPKSKHIVIDESESDSNLDLDDVNAGVESRSNTAEKSESENNTEEKSESENNVEDDSDSNDNYEKDILDEDNPNVTGETEENIMDENLTDDEDDDQGSIELSEDGEDMGFGLM